MTLAIVVLHKALAFNIEMNALTRVITVKYFMLLLDLYSFLDCWKENICLRIGFLCFSPRLPLILLCYFSYKQVCSHARSFLRRDNGYVIKQVTYGG